MCVSTQATHSQGVGICLSQVLEGEAHLLVIKMLIPGDTGAKAP